MRNEKLRELMFMISEVDENSNPFGIALEMMLALSKNEITNDQFELLAGNLLLNCQRYKIETLFNVGYKTISLF